MRRIWKRRSKQDVRQQEEDERVQVAPNMEAGGLYIQATSDPEEEEERKKSSSARRESTMRVRERYCGC